MPSPSPSQLFICINRDDKRVYTKELPSIASGPTPSDRPEWTALLLPSKTQLIVALPLQAAPLTKFNWKDCKVDYYPNWNAVRSSSTTAVTLNPKLLPKEGYTVFVGGLNLSGYNKSLGNARSIKSRFPRIFVSTKMHPQLNLAKFLRLVLGSVVGFNNIGFIKVGNDTIFISLTCGISPSTATLLQNILNQLQALIINLARELNLPSYKVVVIILHRETRYYTLTI